MKLLRLSLRILKSHLGLTLLLCLEIILSMVTFATLYNNYSWGTQQVRMLYDNDLFCAVYYQGPMMQVDGEGNLSISTAGEPEVQEYLSRIDGYLGRSSTSYLEVASLPEGVRIQMVDSLSAQRMKLPVSSGNWFTDVNLENGRIPCVVVDRTNALVLNDGTSTTVTNQGAPSLDTVYTRLGPDAVQLICGPIEGITQPSTIIRMEYFDPAKVDQAQLTEIAQTLSQYGYCYALPEMGQTTQAQFLEQFQDVLPLAVTLLIVVVCSLICISLLNARRQLRTFSIYQICGASWPKCIAIYAIYFAVLYLVSCLIFVGYMLLKYSSDELGLFYQYAVTKEFIGISALLFLAVAVLSVLPPFFKAFRQSPLTGYRRKD